MKYLLILPLLVLVLGSFAQEQKKQWTLKDCVDYAIENNISIQQAGIDIQDAELEKKSALGNFLPSANINSSLAWNKGLNQDVTTGLFVDQTVQNSSVGAIVGVSLFTGLRNLNSKRRAELSMLATRYQLDDMKDNVSLLIASAYLQILFNNESYKVLQSQRDITQHEIDRTKELITSGVVPPGDLFEIEASLASLEQQIVNAENNIRFSKISLAQLLQITDSDNFDVVIEEYNIPESEVIDATPELIFNKAMSVRNIIKISQAQVDIAEKDYEIAKGNYYPTLSGFYRFDTRQTDRNIITGDFEIDAENPTRAVGVVPSTGEVVIADNYNAVTAGSDPLFDQYDRNKGHAYGFQLNIPVFNRFTTKVSTQRSRLNVERAKLRLEQNKVDLESNVHQAYNDAKGALKSFHAAEKTLIARQEAFNYAEQRHDVGVINSFEFQRTKQLLEAAESDVVRTKYDYIFKLKILEFYFGIPIAQ
ncbi:MAG: TolC family protein [Reichenbachiella sp.]